MTSAAGASTWQVWVQAARPRTLPAAIAPVLVASALAWRDGAFLPVAATACLVFALLVQVGTNFANDYFDFLHGADTAERVGPRRAVAAGLVRPETMKRAMIGVFGCAFLSGLTLLAYGGWPLLVIGLVSIACGVAYTGGPYPLAYHGLGDVFVFIFFGLVAVTATYFVQAGQVRVEAWLIGAGIGALATNILALNNYRDIETDRRAHKRTLAVRFGAGFTRAQIAGGHLVAALVPILLAGRDVLHAGEAGFLVIVALIVGVREGIRLRRAGTPAELIELLGHAGMYLAVYALLLSLMLVN